MRAAEGRRARSPRRGLVLVTTSLSLLGGCRHGAETAVGDAPAGLAVPDPGAVAEPRIPPELAGTTWRLVRLDNREMDPDLPAVTLTFKSGRARGSGGCNWYTGWLAEPAAGRLVFSHLAVTRRSCVHPRIMDREARFLAALEGSEAYRLDGDALVLSGEPAGSLEFRRL